jgi:hypothetical protein
MIFAHADVTAGVPHGTALTNENVTGDRGLAARLLQTQATAVAVATVA